ncbi:MAG: uroporphyrinogen decarboxylase family protein, partial [Thermoguttaceae bacterium]
MNGKQRILAALRRQVPDTVPVFEWFVDVTVGQALVGSGDALDVVEGLDLDAVNVWANYRSEKIDARTLVDEWGMKRQLTGDVLPAVIASPIADITRHAEFRFPDPEAPHRFETLERALDRFGQERAIVLNLRDGFSDMRDLLGYEGALMGMLLEPDRFDELLQRSVEYNLQLAAVARRRYGTEIVATTDDVANAGGLLMRPATYFERLAPGFKAAIGGYKDLGYLVIKHCDGNVDTVLDFWIEAGIDCLDPIDPAGGYTIAGMKSRIGDRVCLKGNVDCTGALCSGTPEEVAEEVRQCIAGGAAGGGLILSSSNTIH